MNECKGDKNLNRAGVLRSAKPTVEELERLLAMEDGKAIEITPAGEVMPGGLLERIRGQLNAVSAENGSNTPDFILAEYLISCLAAYERAVNARERWYGRMPMPGEPNLSGQQAAPSPPSEETNGG